MHPPSSSNSYVLDLNSRLGYLRVSADDISVLRGLWPAFEPRVPGVLELFYRHLGGIAELAHFFDGKSLEPIKRAQHEHWRRVFNSGFDAEYAESVTRIGAAHARIGLEPRWFIGAYALVLTELRVFIAAHEPWSAKRRASGMDAIIKAVFMDMDCIISVYNNLAEERQRESQRAAVVDLIGKFDGSVSTRIASLAAASEELSQTSTAIAQETSRGSELAKQTSEMTEVAQADNEALASCTSAITKVVDLIRAIASQTQLLALNASIEAARAGDAGRGFAVVAEEVKKLAFSTAEATGEIESQVQAIQEVSGKVNVTSEKTAENLVRIAAIIETIVGSTREQSQATGDIAGSIGEIQGAIGGLFSAVRTGDHQQSVATKTA